MSYMSIVVTDHLRYCSFVLIFRYILKTKKLVNHLLYVLNLLKLPKQRARQLQIWSENRLKVTNFPYRFQATNGLEKPCFLAR